MFKGRDTTWVLKQTLTASRSSFPWVRYDAVAQLERCQTVPAVVLRLCQLISDDEKSVAVAAIDALLPRIHRLGVRRAILHALSHSNSNVSYSVALALWDHYGDREVRAALLSAFPLVNDTTQVVGSLRTFAP